MDLSARGTAVCCKPNAPDHLPSMQDLYALGAITLLVLHFRHSVDFELKELELDLFVKPTITLNQV